MRVAPLPSVRPLSAQEKWLDGVLDFERGHGYAALLLLLNRRLKEHPDFAAGYVLRLEILCKGNDADAILSDINNALKYRSNLPRGDNNNYYSETKLLSLRANLEHANGNYQSAIEDLDQAIRSGALSLCVREHKML
jgi:tetratricopeptide (TPR) repeat protein